MSDLDTDSLRTKVLLTAGRWDLAAVLTMTMFVALVALSLFAPTPMRDVFEQGDALWTLFTSLMLGVITAVVLVGTFNQLVLSQELGALGDQRERMEAATKFRADTQEWMEGGVSPPTPAAFLRELLAAVERTADHVHVAAGRDERERAQEVAEFGERVADEAGEVQADLADADFGSFDMIAAALRFDYSWEIYQIHRFRVMYADALNDDTLGALTDLSTVLQLYAPAREHFKTTYFQWDLMNLSRGMLYTSVPALTVSIGMTLYVDATAFAGSLGGIDAIVVLVAGAVAISLMPFFLFLSYVIRIATIAKRTLAIGPFILTDVDETTE